MKETLILAQSPSKRGSPGKLNPIKSPTKVNSEEKNKILKNDSSKALIEERASEFDN